MEGRAPARGTAETCTGQVVVGGFLDFSYELHPSTSLIFPHSTHFAQSVWNAVGTHCGTLSGAELIFLYETLGNPCRVRRRRGVAPRRAATIATAPRDKTAALISRQQIKTSNREMPANLRRVPLRIKSPFIRGRTAAALKLFACVGGDGGSIKAAAAAAGNT